MSTPSMVHPDDRQHVIEHLFEALHLQLCEIEYRITRKDGAVRWISHVCQPVVDEDGNYLGRRASDRDTRGNHEIQEELRRSEEKFRNLFSTMSEAFALHEMIYDAEDNPVDYRFLDVNDAFERITGLTREAVIGKTVRVDLPGIEDYWVEM
jgi:PAS domain-containing protein